MESFWGVMQQTDCSVGTDFTKKTMALVVFTLT